MISFLPLKLAAVAAQLLIRRSTVTLAMGKAGEESQAVEFARELRRDGVHAFVDGRILPCIEILRKERPAAIALICRLNTGYGSLSTLEDDNQTVELNPRSREILRILRGLPLWWGGMHLYDEESECKQVVSGFAQIARYPLSDIREAGLQFVQEERSKDGIPPNRIQLWLLCNYLFPLRKGDELYDGSKAASDSKWPFSIQKGVVMLTRPPGMFEWFGGFSFTKQFDSRQIQCGAPRSLLLYSKKSQ